MAKEKQKREPAKPVDLSEYAEEAVPFDTVMRQILKAKPMPRTTKRTTSKTAAKRK